MERPQTLANGAILKPAQIRDNDTAGCTNVFEKGNLKNTLPPHDTLDPHVQLFQQANQQPHLPVMDRARDMLDRGTMRSPHQS